MVYTKQRPGSYRDTFALPVVKELETRGWSLSVSIKTAPFAETEDDGFVFSHPEDGATKPKLHLPLAVEQARSRRSNSRGASKRSSSKRADGSGRQAIVRSHAYCLWSTRRMLPDGKTCVDIIAPVEYQLNRRKGWKSNEPHNGNRAGGGKKTSVHFDSSLRGRRDAAGAHPASR